MAASKKQMMTTLARYLDGEYSDLKQGMRAEIDRNPMFKMRFDLPLDEYREITYRRAIALFTTPEIQQQFSMEAHEKNFINRSLAIGEIVSTTDLSVGVKMGVMGWLYGGAVTNLGSQEHIEKYFRPLARLELTGMFAMSEQGHGSNVRGIQTEAHFNPQTQEFVIHTPTPAARKIYIGNAMYGDYAAVFAQLYTGGQCRGPHCFIVKMRDEKGIRPGITIHDMGLKEGLNGVDNGIISFDHVHIPRENLLNKFADVAPDGTYNTTIESDGARFNTTISALLGARISLSLQALAAMKIGLQIAVTYSFSRRQFGPSGSPETRIIDYQTHQLRLMPKLATAVGLMFTARHVGEMLDEAVHQQQSILENRRLQALAAGLKAYSTWQSVEALQACRECTGGMGYMEENRISNLKRDADVFVTFEGDNVVMLQQVVKELLVQYQQRFEGSQMRAALSGAVAGLVDRFRTSFLAFSMDEVTSFEFVQKAFLFKEEMLLRNLAARLINKVAAQHEEPFLAWTDCLDHVTSLALCHIQRVTLEQFQEAVNKCPVEEDKKLLQKFCDLYCVHIMYCDRAWHLEHKYITPGMAKDLRDQYLALCRETKDLSRVLIEAFMHPVNAVHAPIAGIPTDKAEWAYFPNTPVTSKL